VYYDTGFLIGLKALSRPLWAVWPAIRWRWPVRFWWAAGSVFLLLGQCLQGSAGLHPDHPVLVALA
jgi:hypothetical protein